MPTTESQITREVEEIGATMGGEIATLSVGDKAELAEVRHPLADCDLAAVPKAGILGLHTSE